MPEHCLSALTRTHQRDHAAAAQRAVNSFEQLGAVDQPAYTMKNNRSMFEFHSNRMSPSACSTSVLSIPPWQPASVTHIG